MYHGWTDPLIAPENGINYYTSVLDKMGGVSKAGDSIRLFMVPGMDHCGGGEGPNSFDSMNVIEQWVEKGNPPAQIVASHLTGGQVDTRVRSAPIRRWRVTKDPAASMKPPTSSVRQSSKAC